MVIVTRGTTSLKPDMAVGGAQRSLDMGLDENLVQAEPGHAFCREPPDGGSGPLLFNAIRRKERLQNIKVPARGEPVAPPFAGPFVAARRLLEGEIADGGPGCAIQEGAVPALVIVREVELFAVGMRQNAEAAENRP